MKKILGVAIFKLLLGIFILPASSGFTFVVNNETITITGLETVEGTTEIVIPGRIDGIPVTAIGDNAFQRNQLTNVTIPDSVITIGNGAFSNNPLASVTIGNGVITIGDNAFFGNQLSSITIGSSVTTIGRSAFANDPSRFNMRLASITIPDNVTTIGRGAFIANGLTSITIGPNVTIADAAFLADRSDGFARAYNTGGRQAGTYTRPNTGSGFWTRR